MGVLRTNKMTNLVIDIFSFFVFFAVLNVVFAGISNVILRNFLMELLFCRIMQ